MERYAGCRDAAEGAAANRVAACHSSANARNRTSRAGGGTAMVLMRLLSLVAGDPSSLNTTNN